MRIRRAVTLGLFSVMVVAFFLPWVAVSCYGQRALDISGFQFATAVPAEEMSPGKVSAQTSLGERADVPQALQLAAIAAIIGAVSGVLVIAARWRETREINGAILIPALIVVGALVWFMVEFSIELDQVILPFMTATNEVTGITTWFEVGFILMFAAAVIALFYATLYYIELGRAKGKIEDVSYQPSPTRWHIPRKGSRKTE